MSNIIFTGNDNTDSTIFGFLYGCISITFILTTLVRLSFPIASYVVGFMYYDNLCSVNSLVPLPVWLIAYGAFEFTVIIYMYVVLLLTYFWSEQHPDKMAGLDLIAVLIKCLSSLWLLAWFIVGAVSLFRDSMDCYYDRNIQGNISLWAMTLAILIWQCIIMISNGEDIKNRNKKK